MARIRRAQARGRSDVKLSKEELGAYQRRLQRMATEGRRQRQDERVAVPISHLGGPGSRQNRGSVNGDSPSEEPSPESSPAYPPMGYFPPPASRGRHPSGASSSRTPSQAAADRDPSSSPFAYTYVRGEPPAVRHPSDPTMGGPLAITDGSPASVGAQSDPFQYMTGARTPHRSTTAPTRVTVGEVDDGYASYGSGPAPPRRQSTDPREVTSSEDDRRVHGARVASSGGSRSRHRELNDSRRDLALPSEALRSSRDRTPPPVKKSSSSSTAVPSLTSKRKSITSSTKSVRKKK